MASEGQAGGDSAAPSGLWLVTLLVVLVFTAGRVGLAAALELRIDEAYYWAWSKQNVLSFLDHPPLVAWMVRLGTTLFGDSEIGARAAFLLAMPLIELVFADIVRRRTGSAAASLLVVLCLEANISFGVASMIIEPSIPLALFAGLAVWALCRLEETADGQWWLAVGVFGGLALLSKYTALLFVPAVLAYLVIPTHNRRWLISPWLWSAILIMLLLFLPVLVWNWQHDWASFRFQGSRAGNLAGPNRDSFSTYFLVSLIYYGMLLVPVTLWAAAVLLWRYRLRPDAIALLLAVGFLVPFIYIAERSLFLYVVPTWTVPIWPLGFAALAIAAHSARDHGIRWLRRMSLVGVLSGLPLVGLLIYHGTLDQQVWFGSGRDPLAYDNGYAAAAAQIHSAAEANEAGWIATSSFAVFAVLRWNLRNTGMPVVQVTERSRYVDWAEPDASSFSDQPGLYVYRDEPHRLLVAATGGTNRRLEDVELRWRGVPISSYHVELMEGWTPDLNPPPDSPYFTWPNLGAR